VADDNDLDFGDAQMTFSPRRLRCASESLSALLDFIDVGGRVVFQDFETHIGTSGMRTQESCTL
jgi:hypothetical protein